MGYAYFYTLAQFKKSSYLCSANPPYWMMKGQGTPISFCPPFAEVRIGIEGDIFLSTFHESRFNTSVRGLISARRAGRKLWNLERAAQGRTYSENLSQPRCLYAKIEGRWFVIPYTAKLCKVPLPITGKGELRRIKRLNLTSDLNVNDNINIINI